MYFPRGFDIGRAIELGELVDQAYTQFESFLAGKPWKLPAAYALKRELDYVRPTGKNSFIISGYFDADVRSLGAAAKRRTKSVPIGFVAQRKESTFLIFRGTMSDQEWIQNFRIRMVPYLLADFGKVHDGFLNTYNLFRKAIHEALDGIDAGSRLFIAGHSLGGALATMALPDVATQIDRKSAALYTYGSPRIGDNAFAMAFNRLYAERSFRVVNTSDMVGLIPPPAPIAGSVGGYFTHVDTPIVFTRQYDDIEKNHHIRTHISALRDSQAGNGILNKLRSWWAQHGVHVPSRVPPVKEV